MKKNGRIRTGLKVALLSALMVLVMIPMLAYADDGDPGKGEEKSSVTLNFEDLHTDLASSFAYDLPKDSAETVGYDSYGVLECSVRGSVVTIQFPRENVTEYDVMKFLNGYLDDYMDIPERNRKDKGECLFYKDNFIAKNTIDKYKSNEDVAAEWETSKVSLGEKLSLNVLWRKAVAEVGFTVKPLTCGTSVYAEEGGGILQNPQQDPKPETSLKGGNGLFIIGEGYYSRWFIEEPTEIHEYMISKKWLGENKEVEVKGGETYIAGFPAGVDYGYFSDPDNLPVISINGDEAKYIAGDDGSGFLVYAPVEVEHKWGAGKVTKTATTSAEGEKLFTCSVCGDTKTEVIPKLPPESADKQMGSDGTALGKGASAEAAEKAILAMKKDADPAGSKFAILQLKSTKQTKKSVKVTWKKASGAKKYVIYGNACGTKNKMKKLATVTGTSKNFTKIAGKKVKKGTYYKFLVVAIDNNNKVVSSSKLIHVATTGGKVGNHKKVVVKAKVGKKTKTVSKMTVKKGKTLKLKTTLVPKSKKLKVKKHVKARYESSNTKIATVGGNGKIKAKAKGTCYVFAYAQNGVSKKIKVTVK